MTTTVAIIIQTGNDAFGDEPALETARILEDLAEIFRRDRGIEPRKLFDSNGNVCGEVKVLIVEGSQ
jgi:hypothetical protein